MATTLKTNLKDLRSITVKESIPEMMNLLLSKEQYIMVTKVSHDSTEASIIIKRTSVNLAK